MGVFYPAVVGASSGGEQTIVDVQTLPSGSAIKDVIYRTPGGGDASEYQSVVISYDGTRTISDYSDELQANGFDTPTISSGTYTFTPNALIKYTYNNTDVSVTSIILTDNASSISVSIMNGTSTVDSFTLTTGTKIEYKMASLYIYYAGNSTDQCFSRLVDLQLFEIINNSAVYSGEEEDTEEIEDSAICDVSCKTASPTAAKEGFSETYILNSGNRFSMYIANSNTSASAITLNICGTGAKPIYLNGMPSSSTNYYLPAGVYEVYYDGTNYRIRTDGGFDATNMLYLVDESTTSQIDTYGISDCVCNTTGSTAAKEATSESYILNTGNMFTMCLLNSNTSDSALTLNVAGTGAKPLYINGTVSSSTNYSLPAGNYIVYYDGTNYHVRTDGAIPCNPSSMLSTLGLSDIILFDT